MFDPFQETLFSAIRDDSTLHVCASFRFIPQMFDMFLDAPLASYRSPDSCSFTTLLYNQYKPGVMAVGCSNHSIQLFSTNNRGFSDLFSTLYHPSAENQITPPSLIETEFDIRDISWNSQNPSDFHHSVSPVDMLAACGMSDGNAVCVWDIRRPYVVTPTSHLDRCPITFWSSRSA